MTRITTKSLLSFGFALATMFTSVTALAGPVVNGGFETGDLSGWTYTGQTDASMAGPGYSLSGDNAAFLTQTGATGRLSQTLATEIGHFYSLAFSVANLGGGIDNANTVASFSMFFNNDQPKVSLIDKTATDFIDYFVFFTATAETILNFEFRHDDSYWVLDNVELHEAIDVEVGPLPTPTMVPEPATLLLFAAVLPLLARRRT